MKPARSRARAGASGEIEIARRDLVPFRGNGKLDGLDSDVLELDEFALPEIGRVEIVLELDGLHERCRTASAAGRAAAAKSGHQKRGGSLQGRFFQNVRAFRSR